jgi:hypothetical protein
MLLQLTTIMPIEELMLRSESAKIYLSLSGEHRVPCESIEIEKLT